MTLIILTGGIDLSVGAILALAGAVAAGLLKNGLTLDVRRGASAVHTVRRDGRGHSRRPRARLVQRHCHHAFPTAAVRRHARHVEHRPRADVLWTGGFPITQLDRSLVSSAPVPGSAFPCRCGFPRRLVALFYVVSRHTTLGRYIYAVGGSERAAAFSGLNVNRIKVQVYMLGGGLAGVAGLLLTARLIAADPNAGLGYELDSIAAVVIGGTSLERRTRLDPRHGARLPDHRRVEQRPRAAGGFAVLADWWSKARHPDRRGRGQAGFREELNRRERSGGR